MPRITPSEMKKMKYQSMVDFNDKVDGIDRIDEKIRYSTKYLLSYRNREGEADYSFAEAVHLARFKITETALQRRKLFNSEYHQQRLKDNPQTVDPNYAGGPEDLDNEFFIGNPQTYLSINTTLLDRNLTDDEIMEKDTYQSLLIGGFAQELDNIEKNPNAIDVRFRLERRIGSKEEVELAYKKTKPGFLSKMFNTSSKEYKNLDTMWKAFNNPQHAMYGDLNGLKSASNQYLQHKFPNWKVGDPITNEMRLGLDKTELARVDFCDNINAVVDEQKEMINDYHELVDSCTNLKITFKDINNLSPVQNLFQKQLEEKILLEELDNEPEESISKKEDEPEVEEIKEKGEIENK